jgi:CheY-like chemotaxis protein
MDSAHASDLAIEAAREGQPMPRKALVVDSDFFFVEFLAGLLEKRGYRVLKAYDGKQGIANLEDGPFDVLFADLVMPKVDGRQFFKVVRKRFDVERFPLVALSGTLVEQMDDLDTIGADYFIAKGPIEKLSVHLNEFMAGLESRPGPPPAEKKILQTGGVFPRRDAMELLGSLEFYQAAVDCLGVGVLILDRDTRIINANAAALSIVDRPLVDLLNRPIWDAFPPNRSGELISALKITAHRCRSGHSAFFVGLKGRMLRAVVSPLCLNDLPSGWVIALEGASA